MIPMPALAQLGGAARTIVVPIFAHVSVRTRRSRCKKGGQPQSLWVTAARAATSAHARVLDLLDRTSLA